MAKDVILTMLLAALIVTSVAWVAKVVEAHRAECEVEKLKTELSDCKIRESSASATIERQNEAVERVRVCTVYVDKLIKQAEKKYIEVREVVIQSREKDSSCANKVDNIDYTLRRFHSIGMRPEDGNKN